ncbi:putative metal-binding motif-containing protein [Vitiosangium sp. GDMCC 1.1324]|uniref:putative metal-binding motif-containing protein n=1 Tax=Vitiosangium sp. (strain GDMCC 1.1324) TaxID=2138576 RepID=UPI000D365B17|nr:putative metal-binding motif-containing protein [Vitiosangium sp. GDMCC 1.1324]PTL82897.1 hypothetical protein DAT35_12745 [Vitiosangium sp. GDMCC 1.1324]
MSPRLLLLAGLLAFIGTGCRNNDGAVKLIVSYSGFKPGCLRVGVKDAEGAGEARTTELAGKGEVTGGTVTVAAYRESGWSNTLTVTAEAFEQKCEGSPVVTATETVTVGRGDVAEKELKLEASDADQDGYVSKSTGGSDCDDNSIEVHPGVQELCNGRDDNCDGVLDEGFQLGLACDAAEGCTGVWSCGTQGARICEQKPGMWRPDVDKDGQGSRTAPGVTSCKPPEGYVPNDLDCDDTNARRYTGAPELCNAVDDDCDDVADEGLGVGDDCTGESGCNGKRACAPDGGVVCNSPNPTMLYADNDNDHHGAPDAGVSSCEPTRPGYVESSDDCDDTRANVYTGAPELCDSLDNDCDGTPDDGLGVGTSCDPGQGCTGTKACEADGGTRCDYVTLPLNYYPDEDLDQHGKQDAGVLTCAPDAGYILDAGDCDDGNPFTNVDAPELCDKEDNNCNGTTTDESGVCPSGSGSWVDYSSAGGDVWRSVAVWGDGGVWVTGGTNLLAVRQPGQTSFTSLTGQCSGVWNAVWANPGNGTAALGGNSAVLGSHTPTGTTCDNYGAYATNTDVRGIVGVPLSGGTFEFHMVGADKASPSGGRVLRSDGVTTTPDNNTVAAPLWDVHGISREVLFAVGGDNDPSGVNARIYRFNPGLNTWEDQNVQSIPGVVDSNLQGVWVVSPKLAYAVGNNGSVLIWNGTSWSPMPGPSSEDLLSVLAFGKSVVYVSTASGNVYRYNGSSWSAVPIVGSAGKPFNDLAGSNPGDIWVVGDKGKRYHWPQ